RFAETKTPSDPVLRHAVVMAFTGLFERQIASGNKLEDLLSQATYSQPARLAVAVALRRLHHPRIADYVSDSDPFVQTEAARGINDELISPAMMALARQPVVDSTPAALAIRIVNANYRLGGPAAAERVVEIASTESLKDPWRKRAFEALLAWKSGTELDAVTGIYRLRAPKDAPFLKALVTTRLGRLMKGPANLRELAIKLSAQLKIEDVVPELEKTLASEEAGIAIRVAALQALDEVNPGVARKYVEQMLKSEHPELRMESVTIAVRQKLPNAGEVIRTALADGTMAEKQNAIANLAKLPASAAESELARLLEQFQQGSLDASVQLDVLNAAAKVTSPAIQQQLSKVEQQLENGTVMQKYAVALEGGDIERGRELFFGNAAASCRRCHVVNGDGGGVGPDLSEIAKQNPRSYLLESIVDPNAKIAKGFATELIITIEGKVISGIVKEETEETITLVKPLGEIVIISKDDVEERAPGKSGMPADLTSQLTRAEIRDLVAYLATLTEKKVSTDHGKEQ
ncbi:MAG: c-type cytochrome, partial [Planctomycetaceae bacterium]|nr:c-type cytochrome [Planctomycetaceae bacterium]